MAKRVRYIARAQMRERARIFEPGDDLTDVGIPVERLEALCKAYSRGWGTYMVERVEEEEKRKRRPRRPKKSKAKAEPKEEPKEEPKAPSKGLTRAKLRGKQEG